MNKGEMTPTMVVDYAEGILLKKFRENVVHMGKIYRNIPAYQWPGAGSEKGGSSGHLNFSKIIFAESEGLKKGERLAISSNSFSLPSESSLLGSKKFIERLSLIA